MEEIIKSIAYILPSIVTGIVAYYMFRSYTKQQISDKEIQFLAEKRKKSLPIKLQSYERMLLFCERINPVKIVVRIKPISEKTIDYLHLLLSNIEQEFEHNLVQQIYITDTTWAAILSAKNATINKLKQVAETSKSANDLRENIIIGYSKTLPPTDIAIDFIKNEVKKIL